eukprot:scaffold129965_cov59-Attheya_sp.AAC.2
MDQMFYETAPPKSGVKKNTKPPVVHKLRGTNVVERGNRRKNETVAHLSRQRADRDNQRLVIFGTKDNARVEKKRAPRAEGRNRADEMIGVKPSPIGYVLSIPMPGCMWASAPTPPVLYLRPHQVAVTPAKQNFPCKYRDLKLVECWNTREFGGNSETFRSEATWKNEEKKGRLREKLSTL